MNKKRVKIEDISKPTPQLTELRKEDFKPLPEPFETPEKTPAFPPLSEKAKEAYECSLDGTIALSLPKPKSKEEENELIKKFLSGLEKLFTRENNWVFLQPLLLSMDHCAKCHTCSDACHIYEASGNNPVYRPAYRSEVFRRLYKKYLRNKGGLLQAWRDGEIELNWTALARLVELAYRCNICRRCAQTCPIGVDNGLIAREIRKLFSQEMGIAPKELHNDGTVLQLKVGSTTGMNELVVKDNIEFIDEDVSEKTGMNIKTPWDKEGADILLLHNAGEIMAWPMNPGAFAVIFESAGISWTMSSELAGYDAVNYGLFYDDAQLARIVLKHAEAAKKLKVKKIVMGECGHAHKALGVIANRILTGDMNIPIEAGVVTMEKIISEGRLKLDPSRNDFPVTLHDPCNLVRLMGIVEPQRRILRKIAPRFREMTPHGINNYCCGGGSGFAIMGGHNFPDWRTQISSRKKLEQILNAFKGELDPSIRKYVCAPCSNCKGSIRDLINYYDLWEKHSITYDGLVELIVNCMEDVKPNFIEWEQH
ncbi:MAG: (Fe-S)-binding protein [Planctomycetota bacterium]